MGTNLYVGNVSYNTPEAEVHELFSQVGNVVRCNLITDKYTGRSRGFAFVEMASQEDAEKAINELNGRDLDGRPLVVNEARPREDRGDRPRRDWR